MFKGSFVALITPFKNKKVDDKAFVKLIEDQIKAGTDGVVVCGTTGEAATMSAEEYEHCISLCVKTVNKRVPVIAGCGTNSTEKTIENTKLCKKLGVDAGLIVTPYYNKPTQVGLYEHYKAVVMECDLPIILYNVPGRTGVNISIDTIGKLAKLKNIVGIKDATNDLLRPIQIREVAGEDFSILSGEDATIVAFLAHGGDGCISVSANIVPEKLAKLHDAWQEGDFKTVAKYRDELLPVHQVMFIETNPCPVKYAASLIGYGDGSLRLPLVEVSDNSKLVIKDTLKKVGVL
ncbi:MAG: 4-hydroxy-tetrahydrodipicolinate synthase [Alphaproteobacteria bacterium]|nr:4-hydroxy-tetrahydrodipicolinate synthase [Alphaproteobacteria bacterium]